MLIRVADALYWMSRNLERSEKTASLLSVQVLQVLESQEEDLLVQEELYTAVNVAASKEEADRLKAKGTITLHQVLSYLLFAKENPNSVMNCVRVARENARSVRDHINDDLWQIINVFFLDVEFAKFDDYSDYQMQRLLQRVKMTSLSAQGVIESTTMRGMPYQIMKIGKWMERAEYTQRMLQAISEKVEEDSNSSRYFMRLALQMINGSEAFLQLRNASIEPSYVLHFMIAEPNFPGSIQYCLKRATDAIVKLEGERGSSYTQLLVQEINIIIERVMQLSFEDVDLDQAFHDIQPYYTPLKV
ncbi:alpha-E domain-containing protein [Geomicrobium sediminis]|uniref:Alpha-E superfamily protein n=1 Tax=Geomicrobium sediminis TaxID=1347788 RepID=A0ABS2PHZ2_9BACL|nr:alpha-E domain-containing protein [Geomicrobium sediminis]MBM7634726.1 putative alpha-E superfamily protein [Geomicrobium sediminis]